MKRRTLALLLVVAAVVGSLVTGCGGTPIQYYQPSLAPDAVKPEGGQKIQGVLSVETFAVDAAYDDQRIVYRTSDYRFDYYHFHRWSASPGELVSTALREVYRRTGRFQAVVGGLDPRARLLLGGRIVALEEVDESEEKWKARVLIELTLRDNMTGELLWSELVEEMEPVKEQTPEGVARAVSRALTRIGLRTAPEIAKAGQGLSAPSETR